MKTKILILCITVVFLLACTITPTVTDAPIIAESYRYRQWMATAPEVVRTGAGKMQEWEMP